MKNLSSLAGLVVMLGFVGSAAADENVTFNFNFQLTGPTTAVGTYTVAGTINESGPADVILGFTFENGALILSSVKGIHLAGGDIYLAQTGAANFVGPTGLAVSATWELRGGTGIYRKITGKGTAQIVGDVSTGQVTGVYVGKIQN